MKLRISGYLAGYFAKSPELYFKKYITRSRILTAFEKFGFARRTTQRAFEAFRAESAYYSFVELPARRAGTFEVHVFLK